MWLRKRIQEHSPKDDVTLLSNIILNICSFYSVKGFTTVSVQFIHACIPLETPYRYGLVIDVTGMQFSGKFNYCVCAIFHGIV